MIFFTKLKKYTLNIDFSLKNIKTVSYTHLDVYKRQAVKFAKENGHDVVIVDTAGRLAIDEQMMNEIKSVSYTHLDVYKRQINRSIKIGKRNSKKSCKSINSCKIFLYL